MLHLEAGNVNIFTSVICPYYPPPHCNTFRCSSSSVTQWPFRSLLKNCVALAHEVTTVFPFLLSPQRRRRAPPRTSPARTDSASPLAGAATESPSVPTVQTRLMQSAVSSCLVAPGARANTTRRTNNGRLRSVQEVCRKGVVTRVSLIFAHTCVLLIVLFNNAKTFH